MENKKEVEVNDLPMGVFEFHPHKEAVLAARARILDILPQKMQRKERLVRSAKAASLIFEDITNYYIKKRGIQPIRNHVLLEKVVYDDMQRTFMSKGAKIASESILLYFQRMSLGRRLLCAFKSRLR